MPLSDLEANEENSQPTDVSKQSYPKLQPRNCKFKNWFRIGIYTIFILCSQSAATLLGRLYYGKGGKSKWMGTLVQLVGFPILLPYYAIILKRKTSTRISIHSKTPHSFIKASVYFFLGLLVAADCYLYSIGLLYLPVSTFSLICASQLAFNAFFSFFLNSQKFTPYIINSLVVLTISSILLVFQDDSSENSKVSKSKYVIGFICTIGASAGYGLVLSLTQLTIHKLLRKSTFSVIMEIILYESLVATCATVLGLFRSGEWRGLNKEMNEFGLGKVSYVMTLTWTAILWQVFSIGTVGLIFEVSSLFSNVISVLGSPIVPVLAVIFFKEKMNGAKVMALILAIWGFISYVYQQFLDDHKSNSENKNAHGETGIPTQEEING